MKENVSITLPSDLPEEVDRLAGPKQSRSAFIERVLRNFFSERTRGEFSARDLRRINAAADRLNAEAEDVLSYQRQPK